MNSRYAGAWALPNELVLEVAKLASANSQSDYRNWLLLSNGWYEAVRFVGLSHVPVHLFSNKALVSFANLLQKYPGAASYVHHLWTISSGKMEIAIVRACTNLISLACQSKILTSISSMPIFKHTALHELTVMTVWSPWEDVMCAPHAEQLCSQITHLRHFEGLPADFPAKGLTALEHLSFASHIYRDSLMKHLSRLGDMKTLESIVVTTSWPRATGTTPQDLARALQGIDKRLRAVHCEKGFSERDAWCERIRLGNCLWSVARPDTIIAVGSDEPRLTPY